MITIALARESDGWPEQAALLAMAERIISESSGQLELKAAGPCEFSLVFADDAMVKALNAKWRGKDKPTNVLSFPAFQISKGGKLPQLLGDVVLAFETTAREAAEEGKPLDHHISHLVLHGLLHLLGYDHESGAEAEEMEALEREILAKLAIPDPYAVIDEAS